MLKSMDTLVALCKNRGFIYPGSEIYGGLANTWDYGPLGNELKNNVKAAWRKKFIQEQPNIVGLDAAILMIFRQLGRIFQHFFSGKNAQTIAKSLAGKK